MSRPRKKSFTPQELIFLQLYLASGCPKEVVGLWRDAHQKPPEDKDRLKAKRFLERPETIEYFAQARRVDPVKVMSTQVMGKLTPVDEKLRMLRNIDIDLDNLIAFARDNLALGAHEVLDDLHSENPQYGHLVESYKRRVYRDKDGNETVTEEIRIPLKKDAIAILTKLKGWDQVTGKGELEAEEAERRFMQSEYFQEWLAKHYRNRIESGEITVEGQSGQMRQPPCISPETP